MLTRQEIEKVLAGMAARRLFDESRRYVADLGAVRESWHEWGGCRGVTYLDDGLFIHMCSESHRYTAVMGTVELETDSLEVVEEALFQYARQEGLI